MSLYLSLILSIIGYICLVVAHLAHLPSIAILALLFSAFIMFTIAAAFALRVICAKVKALDKKL